MVRIETRTVLDREVLDEILELIETATALEGHRPVGEHKYSHLAVGARGWVGVLAYEERHLVGYAHTRWNLPGERPRLAVEVVVHPGHYDRGIAQALLAEVDAFLAHAGGGLLYLWVHRVEDARATLAHRLGYDVQRELAFMVRDLTSAPESGSLPDGIVLRPYRGDEDDAEFLRVNNAAFEGHPENGSWDQATFAHRRKLEWFDPADLLMAWQGERLVGFHWTKWHGHDSDEQPAHEPVGEVYVLAVDPRAQALGLGRALLDAGLAHLHARGCRVAVLYVDRASTPAARLYASAGFRHEYLEVCFQREVEPAAGSPGVDLLRPT